MTNSPTTPPISYVVFDLDGTLLHSAPDLHRAANLMLNDLGLPQVSLSQVTSFIGNGVPKLVERSLRAAGQPPAEADLASAYRCFMGHYDAAPVGLTELYPGVLGALRSFKAAGIPMGICTNKPESSTRMILQHFEISSFFGSVVGGDTLAVRKPDPLTISTCLNALSADAVTTLYVGDSETDQATAQAANLRFALFSQGYRKTPLAEMSAELIFDHFEELTAFCTDSRA